MDHQTIPYIPHILPALPLCVLLFPCPINHIFNSRTGQKASNECRKALVGEGMCGNPDTLLILDPVFGHLRAARLTASISDVLASQRVTSHFGVIRECWRVGVTTSRTCGIYNE